MKHIVNCILNFTQKENISVFITKLNNMLWIMRRGTSNTRGNKNICLIFRRFGLVASFFLTTKTVLMGNSSTKPRLSLMIWAPTI